MGARQSVLQPPRSRTQSSHNAVGILNGMAGTSFGSTIGALQTDHRRANGADVRHRSRSVGGLVLTSEGGGSDSSSDESDGILSGLDRLIRLPAVVRPLSLSNARYGDFKCPVCEKTVPSDDVECHLVMCLTRPRVNYNEDTLSEDKGECVICFDELLIGQVIARLPCLCIYHKGCIDDWFKRKNCCPQHPGSD